MRAMLISWPRRAISRATRSPILLFMVHLSEPLGCQLGDVSEFSYSVVASASALTATMQKSTRSRGQKILLRESNQACERPALAL